MLRKVLIVLALAALLTGCKGAGAETEITLDMTDFMYSSPSITIPVGEPVKISLVNNGLFEHDFVIDNVNAEMVLLQDSGSEAHHEHSEKLDFDIHASAQVGTTTVFELTILEPGTYQFFCSVAGHKEAGMIGELIAVAQE